MVTPFDCPEYRRPARSSHATRVAWSINPSYDKYSDYSALPNWSNVHGQGEELPGPFGATWELRCGPDNRFRVFYEVASDAQEVRILAIGVKDRNRLSVGGKEYLK